ncbi:MAG: hypothetical protein OMOMHJEC_00332 [Xanthomonadales bacterium]|nr:hypothetical protein [Xanthomonadales bacterium]
MIAGASAIGLAANQATAVARERAAQACPVPPRARQIGMNPPGPTRAGAPQPVAAAGAIGGAGGGPRRRPREIQRNHSSHTTSASMMISACHR